MPGDVADRPIKVLVTPRVMASHLDSLVALGQRFRIDYREIERRRDMDAIEDEEFEVLMASFPPRALRRVPALRWLQLTSAGVDGFLHESPWKRGLVVTNARGVYGPAIAQYVLAQVMRIYQRMDEWSRLQEMHRWPPGDQVEQLAPRLARGRKVVIVGYGGVGRETARVLNALGMRIIAVKNRPTQPAPLAYRAAETGDPDASIPECIVGVEQLRDVVELADIIVLSLPLTERSRGIFSADLISAMLPDAWLINVSRGPIVDETALVEALANRRIGGAVLDVFQTEPLPTDHPLWTTPNTVVTPHVSGSETSSSHLLADMFVQNLIRYATKQPLLNVVDGDLQY